MLSGHIAGLRLEVNMAIHVEGMTPLLEVFDIATSLRFYREVLGFQIVTTDANTKAPDHDWVWLRLQDVDLMLNTAYEYEQRPAAPDPKRVAAHHDTCLYFGAPDVEAVYADLRQKGLNLKSPKVAPYGMKQLYLTDPDGYNLCFQWRADKP
jgi:glyoxylase I family protein